MATIKGLELKSWQIAAALLFQKLKSNDKLVVLSPRQCGKSLLLTQLLLHTALNKPKTCSICVSPINRQNTKIFDLMRSMCVSSPLTLSCNESKMEIKFINGSSILFLSAESGDNIRGNTATGVLVIDEAAFIKPNMWAVILPFTNVSRCPIVLSSTPRQRVGFYYESYEKALVKKTHYYQLNASQFDLSYFRSEEQIEDYRQTLPYSFFKSEILGEWMDDNEGVFGDFMKCVRDPDNYNIEFVGIDWSTVGSDSTQVVCFNGKQQMVKILSFNKKDPMEVIDDITLFLNACDKIKGVLVESNSIGEVYYSALKRGLRNPTVLKKFNTSNKSKKEIVESVVSALSKQEITLLDDAELLFQLRNYNIEMLSKGNYTYNAAPGAHDDIIIATCLACHLFLTSHGQYAIL